MIKTRTIELKRVHPLTKLGKLCMTLVVATLIVFHGPAVMASPLMKEAGETIKDMPEYFGSSAFGEFKFTPGKPNGDASAAQSYNQLVPSPTPPQHSTELHFG